MYPEAQDHPHEMVEARAVPRVNGQSPVREPDRRILTEAQIKRINALSERQQRARADLVEFLEYCAEEHGCQGGGWELDGNALVRVTAQSE